MSSQKNANRHRIERERAADKTDSPQALKRRIKELQSELDAVRFAAHMPKDYEFGLPSWINQKLYMAWIGAEWSPDVMEQINSGKLTFSDAPIWKEREALRAQLRRWLDACSWREDTQEFMLNPTLADETKALFDKWGIEWKPTV